MTPVLAAYEQQHPDHPLHRPGDSHPNGLFNRLIAQQLAIRLRQDSALGNTLGNNGQDASNGAASARVGGGHDSGE